MMLNEPPVRLCCMTRHDGPVCPDDRVMCCLCFDRVEKSAPARDEDGRHVDVCQHCDDEERRRANR